MSDIHVVVTDLTSIGQGWDLSSPQMPGLSFGASTPQEALDELPGLVDFYGLGEGGAEIVLHEQKYAMSPSGHEFYVRFFVEVPQTADGQTDQRGQAVGRQLASIENGHVEGEMTRMPTLPTGERLIICACPGDQLGWVLDQLGDGEGAVVCYYAGDDAVWTCPIFDGDREPGSGKSLEALGLTRSSTVEEVMDRVMSGEISVLSKSFSAVPA